MSQRNTLGRRSLDLYSSTLPNDTPVSQILEKSTLIQRQNNTIRTSFVVYVPEDVDEDEDEYQNCLIIEFYIRFMYMTPHTQRRIARSDFLSDLGKKLMVDGILKCPRVFYGGRYLGGLKDLRKIVSYRPCFLKVASGRCTTCGGHGFTLHASSDSLTTCTVCNGSGCYTSNHPSTSLGSQAKLFLCFEGTDSQQRNIYVICSLNPQQESPPIITAVIDAYPCMGFGVYNSKIVLAGGQVSEVKLYNGCITFDMNTQFVTRNAFVPMDNGKYKPLVFQLGKRLYVCDRLFDSNRNNYVAPIEMYSPAVKKRWHVMSNIFFRQSYQPHTYFFKTEFSCLVFGSTCLMSSVPLRDDTWSTNSNYRQDSFVPYSDAPLPFTGVATFHTQDGFDDFVMIYFHEGAVRVCKFNFYGFGDSEELFKTSKSNEKMQAHFADLGMGCFVLTTSDQFQANVCTFVVAREGVSSDPLKLSHTIQSNNTYYYNKLFTEDMIITGVVGCSVPTHNKEAKARVQKAESIHYKNCRKMQADFDPGDKIDYLEGMITKDVGELFSEGDEEIIFSEGDEEIIFSEGDDEI